MPGPLSHRDGEIGGSQAPQHQHFEDAATTPTVYVTVFQAFGDLAASSNTKVGGIQPLSFLSAQSP